MPENGIGLPHVLLAFVHSRFGNVTHTETLSGIAGDGGATRLQFDGGRTVIVKSSASSRERNFYEHHADLLRHCGVGIPGLYWSGCDDAERHWIVIEDIPNPFPQERWGYDQQQIEMLFRLHSGTWKGRRFTLSPKAYQPGWDEEMTERASEWFADGSEREHVANQLTTLQREAQVLFQPLCCISADPNPTNWRVRENGELVLIDWERFSYGHPAIDLAITMPGLGSRDGELEYRLAQLYREFWEKTIGNTPPELDGLERMVRVAKLWAVVEFLANARLKPAQYPEETVRFIVRELPDLLERLGETTDDRSVGTMQNPHGSRGSECRVIGD